MAIHDVTTPADSVESAAVLVVLVVLVAQPVYVEIFAELAFFAVLVEVAVVSSVAGRLVTVMFAVAQTKAETNGAAEMKTNWPVILEDPNFWNLLVAIVLEVFADAALSVNVFVSSEVVDEQLNEHLLPVTVPVGELLELFDLGQVAELVKPDGLMVQS